MTHQQALDWAITCLSTWANAAKLSQASAEQAAEALTTLSGKRYGIRKREDNARFYWRVVLEQNKQQQGS